MLDTVFSMPVRLLDAHRTVGPWCIRVFLSESTDLKKKTTNQRKTTSMHPRGFHWNMTLSGIATHNTPEEKTEWMGRGKLRGRYKRARESQCVRVWLSEVLNQRELNQTHSPDRWMSRREQGWKKKKKKSLSFQLFYLKEPVSDAVLPVLPGNCLNIVTNLSTLPTRLVSKFLLMVQLIVLE